MTTVSPSRLDSTQHQEHYIHRLSGLFLYSFNNQLFQPKGAKGKRVPTEQEALKCVIHGYFIKPHSYQGNDKNL